MIIPTLYTSRLMLRPLKFTDVQSIYDLRSSDTLLRFVDMRPFTHIDQAHQLLTDLFKETDKGRVYLWGLCLLQDISPMDSKVIGTICLCNIQEQGHRAEIGFEIMTAQQNKGLMKEALKEVIRFGFDDLELEQIYAITHQDNLPSLSLLKNEHFKRLAPTDQPKMYIFALLKEAYKNSVLD